jgi:thioredoxin-related protein
MKAPVSITICVLFLMSNFAVAQESKDGLVWQTDIMKANEISKATGKPIFAFFTGSDWCGWCHKLQNEVFAKQSFIDWAKKNVVLLELDFPRKKQLPPALAQQNASLQQALQVQGYPTIWLLYLTEDKESKKINLSTLGSLGYPRGAEPGREEVKFLEDANALLKKGK